MRDIVIKKISTRHYIVSIDGEIEYEGIDKKSCLKYVRKGKNAYLKSDLKRSNSGS